tara:strand:+ start:69 stop:443 length:375 start_codon:yes stop_codon:yes gene_type:complete
MDTYYLFYGVMCVALGGFVIVVFYKMVERKERFSAFLIPLAAYLILWHSWVYPRFDLLPESVWDSPLSEAYWYAHDAVLMLLFGLTLLPLLLKPSPDVGTNPQVREGYSESFASEYEQINEGGF